MEVTRKSFKCTEGTKLNFYFLGDIHEGNVNHAEKEFAEAVKIIRDDENGYWIGMGDYIEAITIDDKKRFNPVTIAKKYGLSDLKDLPYKQIEFVYEKLKSIDHKCIALLVGNHEESYIKYNHSDIYERFASMFKSNPKKLGYLGFIQLRFITDVKTHIVLVCVNHGDGGGGFREGYPVNKVHDVFRWTHADINVMGHIHQLVADDRKITDVERNKAHLVKPRKFWGVSGCFLYSYVDGHANYFEKKGRSESDIGMLKAEIFVGNIININLVKVVLG